MKKTVITLLLSFCLFYVSVGQYSFSKNNIPGTIINHVPASQGIYIGSPSICILPNGNYVASHEFFGPNMKDKSGETHLFLSSNKGKSWEKISTIKEQVWSKLFVLDSTLYIIGPVAGGDDLVIRKSVDGGYNWTTPIDQYTGRIFKGRFHTAPTPVIIYNNRVWKAVEDIDGPSNKWGKKFRAMVVSAPLNCNLLSASNWVKTNPMPYTEEYLDGNFGGWLEGNIVADTHGNLHNILRVDYRQADGEKAAIIDISEDGKTATFNPKSGFINFPGGCKKFNILYDSITAKYWTISNYIPDVQKGYNIERTRNTLALMNSDDLRNWTIKGIVLYHPDVEKHGFQYVDFQFEENDIVFVSRTAYDDEEGGADSQHNANYITFHRIKNYANYKTPKIWANLMPN